MKLTYEPDNEQWKAATRAMRGTIAGAATGAIRDAANQVKRQGRAKIAAAGFSKRWQNALRADVYPKRGTSIGAAAFVYHKIPYAGVFERGATIKGSPFLWLPLPAAPQYIGGRRATPRLYIQRVGPLISIKRPGKRPLLAGQIQAARGAALRGKRLTVAQLRRGQRDARRASANAAFGGKARRFATIVVPLFVGLPSTHIRARFGLSEVFEAARRGLPAAYQKNLRATHGA